MQDAISEINTAIQDASGAVIKECNAVVGKYSQIILEMLLGDVSTRLNTDLTLVNDNITILALLYLNVYWMYIHRNNQRRFVRNSTFVLMMGLKMLSMLLQSFEIFLILIINIVSIY